MRIVVLGAGRMGVIRAEDLAADGRVDEIVIANRNPARAAELAARVGGSTVPWGEWPEADGYAVTTATDTHAELVIAAARAGKAIFCEKPISTHTDDVDTN